MSEQLMAVPELQASSDQQTARTSGVPSAKEFAVEVARVLADTRCHQVCVLDVRGISPVTDFLVLSSGTSPRQMKSASDAAEEVGDAVGYRTLTRVADSAQWIIQDFVDVVVHVFSQDARYYYDLDNLWGDARAIEWERPDQVRHHNAR